MQAIHQLIRSGNATTDEDVLEVIRSGIREHPVGERRDRLKQLELSLDGYGGALSARADRVRALILRYEAEMRTSNE